jgi:integrase
VFWYRNRNGSSSKVTSRRFDTLHERWQTALPWANDERVGYHHLRHSMSFILKTHYGPQYAKRYLRHADGDVTDTYGACTIEELAAALADLLEFEHPLVHGVEDRRAETFERLGIQP